MSVLLIDANKNGKYEFTKEELQAILDRVDLEAFERGIQCGRRMQEPKEKEYVYINSPFLDKTYPQNPYVTWNEVTCTDANQRHYCATTSDQPNANTYKFNECT